MRGVYTVACSGSEATVWGQETAPLGHTLASNGRDSTSTNGLRDKWPVDDPLSPDAT